MSEQDTKPKSDNTAKSIEKSVSTAELLLTIGSDETKTLLKEINGCASMGTPFVLSPHWHKYGLSLAPVLALTGPGLVMSTIANHNLVAEYMDYLHLEHSDKAQEMYYTRNEGMNQYLRYYDVLDEAREWAKDRGELDESNEESVANPGDQKSPFSDTD